MAWLHSHGPPDLGSPEGIEVSRDNWQQGEPNAHQDHQANGQDDGETDWVSDQRHQGLGALRKLAMLLGREFDRGRSPEQIADLGDEDRLPEGLTQNRPPVGKAVEAQEVQEEEQPGQCGPEAGYGPDLRTRRTECDQPSCWQGISPEDRLHARRSTDDTRDHARPGRPTGEGNVALCNEERAAVLARENLPGLRASRSARCHCLWRPA